MLMRLSKQCTDPKPQMKVVVLREIYNGMRNVQCFIMPISIGGLKFQSVSVKLEISGYLIEEVFDDSKMAGL